MFKPALTFLFLLSPAVAFAAGGPLGIDHKWSYDNSGIYKRQTQKNVLSLMVAAEVAGGIWEGDQSRLGKTCWQAIDATLIGSAGAAVGKAIFTRARPTQTDNPNLFFQGNGHYSFPSGEVSTTSAIVTPFILEYREDKPWVWALAALPVYDAVARMKVQAHWQTDVLAGAALGVASGYYAHSREKSFTLQVLPGGFAAGWKQQF